MNIFRTSINIRRWRGFSWRRKLQRQQSGLQLHLFSRNCIRVVSVQICILRRLVASLFLFGLCKVQHEAEYQLLIVDHGMALQLLKDRDKQDNLYRHSVGQKHTCAVIINTERKKGIESVLTRIQRTQQLGNFISKMHFKSREHRSVPATKKMLTRHHKNWLVYQF